MSAAARRIVQLLLVTLVINAGWTFNKEALADVWFDELRSLAVNDNHASAAPENIKSIAPKSPCNHWCHAVGHFVGIFFLHPILLMEVADDYFIVRMPFPLPSLPESRYRPPRLFIPGLDSNQF